MSWMFLKGRDSWKCPERSEAGARRPLWRAAIFDLIVNGTPSFFNGVLGKKVSSDPSGNVTDPCDVKWIYVLRRRCYFNRRSALLFRNVDGLS